MLQTDARTDGQTIARENITPAYLIVIISFHIDGGY